MLTSALFVSKIAFFDQIHILIKISITFFLQMIFKFSLCKVIEKRKGYNFQQNANAKIMENGVKLLGL